MQMGGGLLMRGWCVAFLCLGLTVSGWCAAQDGEVHFKGTIGTDTAFEMTLRFSGDTVSGTYFYVGRTVSLRIKGERSGQALKLNEFTESGAMTGQFSGTYLTPTKIEGQWNVPDGSKTLPFSMESETPAEVQQPASGDDGSARADGFVVGEVKSHRVETKEVAQDVSAEAAPSERAGDSAAKRADAAPATSAPDEGDFQTVEAKGVGITPDAALKDAFSSAVQTAVGVVVDAETLVKNDEVIRDQVLTYSDAIIEKYDEVRSGSRPDGLHEVTIKAVVRRKQLVERLKVAGVTSKPVDGKSVYAEVVSEEQSIQDAVSLMQAKIGQLDYPNSILRAKLLSDKPTVVEKRESDVTILWNIEVTVDRDAYFQGALSSFSDTLEQVALDKSEKTMISGGKTNDYMGSGGMFFRPRLTDNTMDEVLQKLRDMYAVLVVTRSNSSLSNYEYKIYQIDKRMSDVIYNGWFKQDEYHSRNILKMGLLRLDLVSAENKNVFSTQIDLQQMGDKNGGDVTYGVLLISPSREYRQYLIGPFMASAVSYPNVFSNRMSFSYTHDIPIEDLKNVSEARLSFVSASP